MNRYSSPQAGTQNLNNLEQKIIYTFYKNTKRQVLFKNFVEQFFNTAVKKTHSIHIFSKLFTHNNLLQLICRRMRLV